MTDAHSPDKKRPAVQPQVENATTGSGGGRKSPGKSDGGGGDGGLYRLVLVQIVFCHGFAL